MNQIIPFHYLISMSLDDGLTSVQKASKKTKRRTTMMAIKFVSPARVLPFSILYPLYFVRSFLILGNLRTTTKFMTTTSVD